jgi:hypothetical protein
MEKWRAEDAQSEGEAQRLKFEPWKALRPLVADSHHFYQGLDPGPYQSKKKGSVSTSQ